MAKGVSKERGLMLARDRARSSALSHTALSCGEGQMVRARRLSVNLRRAAFETPGNRWSFALPGHDRQDGCRLRLTRPHVARLYGTCGVAAAVGLQDTQPRGYHLQFSLAAASSCICFGSKEGIALLLLLLPPSLLSALMQSQLSSIFRRTMKFEAL